MKEKYGSDFICIMFYGTAGNINQVDVFNTEEGYDPAHDCYHLGCVVYDGLIKVIDDAKMLDGDINVVYNTKIYPLRVPTVEEIQEKQEIVDRVTLPEDLKLDAGSPKELFDACMAKNCIDFSLSAKKYYEVKMQIISIDNLMIFALPGEVFTQYGKKIKKAFSDKKCFFACLSNNRPGYMPAKDCYLPGLYESLYSAAPFYPEDTENIFDCFIELGKGI